MEEEKDVLKRFRKSDQELIHDIIDMELLDASIPIYTKRGDDYDKSDIIQSEGS